MESEMRRINLPAGTRLYSTTSLHQAMLRAIRPYDGDNAFVHWHRLTSLTCWTVCWCKLYVTKAWFTEVYASHNGEKLMLVV
jgi:hypothetical protein